MPDIPIEGYRVRPAAAADLDGIWDHAAEVWGPDQAGDYIHGLVRIFEVLADFPVMARERDEIDPPVLCYPHRSHLIIYRIEEPWLVIVRVVHGRRHWAALLQY